MNKYVCAIFVLDSLCIYAAVYANIEYYGFLYDVFVRYMTTQSIGVSYWRDKFLIIFWLEIMIRIRTIITFVIEHITLLLLRGKETLESCYIKRLNFIRDQNFVIFLSHYNETEGQKDCKFWTKEPGQKSHTP